MTNKEMKLEILKTANAVRKEFKKTMPEGQRPIDINWILPTVAITRTDGQEYFFQGDDAVQLLVEALETNKKFKASVDDVLLWISQSW